MRSYILYSQLDAPKRFFMITVDEFIGAVIGGLFFGGIMHGWISLVIGGAILLSVIKAIKKKHSPYIWVHWFYAYFPRCVTRYCFSSFPDSSNQHYLM